MKLRGLRALAVSAVALGAAWAGVVVAVPADVSEPQDAAPVSTAVELVDARSAEASRGDDRPAATDAEARALALTTQAQQIATTDAALKAEAAAQAAALAKFKAEQGYDPATKDPKEIARQMAANKYGWGDAQFECYNNIIMRESKWDPYADNPTSSAYGIPQALPGSRMAQFGSDWKTNPATQIKWGLWYIADRYGTPCNGWSFKRSHGWY